MIRLRPLLPTSVAFSARFSPGLPCSLGLVSRFSSVSASPASIDPNTPAINGSAAPASPGPRFLPPALLRNKFFVLTVVFLSSTAMLAFRYDEQSQKNFKELETAKNELIRVQTESRKVVELAEKQKNYRQQLIWLLESESHEHAKTKGAATGPYKKSWADTLRISWIWGGGKANSAAPATVNSSVPISAVSASVSSSSSPSLTLDLVSPDLIALIGQADKQWKRQLAAELRKVDAIAATEKIEEIIVKKQEERKAVEAEAAKQEGGFRF